MDRSLLKESPEARHQMQLAAVTVADFAAVSRTTRDQLFAQHTEMARRIAHKLARRVPGSVSTDDLVGAALLGLAEAVARYRPDRGECFGAYAVQRIRGALMDELRRGDIMPRRVRSTARHLGRTVRALEQELGRTPSEDEIAKSLDVTVDEYRDRIEMLAHVAMVELDPSMHLSSTPARAHDELERAQLVAQVRNALGQLPERDALVLSLYYDEELSYAEVGQVLGVTESRVCQLHKRAVAALRLALTA